MQCTKYTKSVILYVAVKMVCRTASVMVYISILRKLNWDAISKRKFNTKFTFEDNHTALKNTLCLGRSKSLYNNINQLSLLIKINIYLSV